MFAVFVERLNYRVWRGRGVAPERRPFRRLNAAITAKPVPERTSVMGSGVAAGVIVYPITSSAVTSGDPNVKNGRAPGVPNASCTCGETPEGGGLLCQSPKSPPSFWLSNCAKRVVPLMEK